MDTQDLKNGRPCPYAAQTQYGALADFDQFKQVAFDPFAGIVTWPYGADFNPETLYHWPTYRNHLFAGVQTW
ncbi:MAG: hypothetical protein A2284_12465 [Deltaproteobacteria bacterium RIFOXYA12_FULL_61_11]|nr:MAG: hypothetical protein A2284_12465 [Deltaproteobacteria bacterium RIFOXYA12_FULL_61_11]